MCSKGFFRRIVPFFATFAIGMFVASFFVTIGAPGFISGEGRRHRHEERCRRENQLRIENEQLRSQLETLRAERQGQNTKNVIKAPIDSKNVIKVPVDGLVPAPDLDDVPPPPPMRPVSPGHRY